ncbi:MAG: hypothetical protein DI582_05085 [Azospirillum brasilense]|nr:MAG: hypothetical protein DI582_05085 [Azospirillum brasilense]
MQLNLVQFLTGAATPQAAGKAAEGTEGESPAKGGFAALLGDAGAQGQKSGQGANQAALPAGLAVSKLLAQELQPEQLLALRGAAGDRLGALLGESITPEDATNLLAQLEQLQAEMGQAGAEDLFGGEEAFAQLQEALEQVEATGEPVQVAELLDSVPALSEAANTANTAERAPAMQRMLQWLQGAIDKQKEAQQVAAVGPVAPDTTAQSLQAAMFPAGDDAAAATQTQDTEQAAPGDVAGQQQTLAYTQLVPLAQHQQVAMPEWVRKLGAGEENIASDAINAAIPPLALEPAETAALPEVDLPGSTASSDAQEALDTLDAMDADAITSDTADKTKAPRPFVETLRALPSDMTVAEAASAPVTQTVLADNSQAMPVASVQALGQVGATTMNGVSHAATNAVAQHQPLHTSTTEQVQMALTTATRDGMDRITLQLEPADLGRVEIKMDIAADGRTQLSFVVDKAETLDALSRDARSLERSLQESGIKADAGSMQFNLRQQPQPQFSDMGGDAKDGSASPQHAANDNSAAPVASTSDGITKHYTINVRDGVDIHA